MKESNSLHWRKYLRFKEEYRLKCSICGKDFEYATLVKKHKNKDHRI